MQSERRGGSCNVTGCREIIVDKETGFLCKVKDVEDLADKMVKMIHLPVLEREKMGNAARERVKEKFTKKIVIDAYLHQITHILKLK